MERSAEDGLNALEPLLATLDAVSSPDDLLDAIVRTFGAAKAPIGVRIGRDPDEPQRAAIHLGVPRLGMEAFRYEDHETLPHYRALVAKMFRLAGDPRAEAERQAKLVVAIETKLAKELQTVPLLANVAHLRQGESGPLPWSELGPKLGRSSTRVFGNSDLLKATAEIWTAPSTGYEGLRAYLRWQIIDQFATDLGPPFSTHSWAFYGTRLRGVQGDESGGWYRCTQSARFHLPGIVDRYFMDLTYEDSSQGLIESMAEATRVRARERLESNDWLDEPTRAAALRKLDQMVFQLGGPDTFPVHEFELGDVHVENVMKTNTFRRLWELDQLRRGVDRRDWDTDVTIANAFYRPTMNRVTIPAGVLQVPYFGAHLPRVVNFARIGTTLGHEIVHAFDPRGRVYDGLGRPRQWWTPAAEQAYDERLDCVRRGYGDLAVTKNASVDPERTLTENVADLGGLAIAWEAWAPTATDYGERIGQPEIAGLRDDELFFIAYAQADCTRNTPETEETLAATDPHTTARHRVNRSLAMFPPFAETFSCEPGDPMVAAESCSVW